MYLLELHDRGNLPLAGAIVVVWLVCWWLLFRRQS